jgi:hypothetical protein
MERQHGRTKIITEYCMINNSKPCAAELEQSIFEQLQNFI